jgi:acyl-homoserine lactone acylase PvdQ
MIPRYAHLRALALLVALVLALPALAQPLSLTAPDGTTVTVERDTLGVPRIMGETEGAVFYGQGYAVAQDRLFQMETIWRAATGRTAELAGPGPNNQFVTQDRNVRTVFYTPEERQAQFDALPEALQTMISNFVAGVNAYIEVARVNPAARPAEYFQPPLLTIGMEEWDVDKAMAVIQLYIRRFGEAGGQELQRLAELQAVGPEWFSRIRPVNDPSAPTTLPDGPPSVTRPYMAYTGPAVPEEVVEAIVAERKLAEAGLLASGVPDRLGSYAVAVAASQSESGNAMLLGAPQMGAPAVTGPGATNRNVIWESELIVGSPNNPSLHIAGMTVVGIPGVIIGRTRDIAWTLTSGVTDNVDTYIVQLIDQQGTYLFNGEPRQLMPAAGTINVLGGEPVPYTRLRTVHGPVIGQDAASGRVFAYRYAFWERETDMAVAFYDVWKASTVAEVEAAIAQLPVSFNFFLLHRDQTIGFYHVGRYPIRPATVDPRLPALGDGSQEWEGFLPFSSHPQGTNPEQGYYVNWNNKPAPGWDHGDVTPWTPYSRQRAYDGVVQMDVYLRANSPLSFDELKGLHRIARENPIYPEYPGSYQQIVEFDPQGGSRAENLVPPGQSAFFGLNAQLQVVPSPHVSDQWQMYLTYEMKPFTFLGEPAVSAEPGALPTDRLALAAPYPNPVTGGDLRVAYALPDGGAVHLAVYDVLGRQVAVLADGEAAPGPHTATLATEALASGVYVLRLSVGSEVEARRFTVAR